MRHDPIREARGSGSTPPPTIAYAFGVAKKNRIFRMDDDTYAKLTALSTYFGMKRAALLRLFIEEKYHQTRRLGKL